MASINTCLFIQVPFFAGKQFSTVRYVNTINLASIYGSTRNAAWYLIAFSNFGKMFLDLLLAQCPEAPVLQAYDPNLDVRGFEVFG